MLSGSESDVDVADSVPLRINSRTDSPIEETAEEYLARVEREATHSGFGGKNINTGGGLALMVNNITGPGVTALPAMFVKSGWAVPSIILGTLWFITTIASNMLCEAMRYVPGNEHFKDRIEYSTVVKHFLGKRVYILALLSLCVSLQCLNVVSIHDSAQTMDATIAAVFGKTCGLGPTGIVCTKKPKIDCDGDQADLNGFCGHATVIGIGYVIAGIGVIPMGLFNLDDNIIVQNVAFAITIACWIVWTISCGVKGFGHFSIPAFGDSWPRTFNCVGIILFNWGFITTVPSFVNEKRKDVSIQKVMWGSTFASLLIFFALGIPPAMSFGDDPTLGDDVTALIQDQKILGQNGWISTLAVFLFPPAAIMSSIPVFSIVIKYNLVENGVHNSVAIMFATVLPWLVVIPFLVHDTWLSQFVDWSSIVFITFTDFVVPFMVFWEMKRRLIQANGNTEKEEHHEGHRAHYAIPPVVKFMDSYLYINRRTTILISYLFCGILVLFTLGLFVYKCIYGS